MKKFTSIILLIVSLTTIFSFTAFAQEHEATNPTIKSVRALNSKQVKVFFEGNVDINAVEDITNYKLHKFNSSTTIEILTATYNSADNTAILNTAMDFSAGTAYMLEINNICSDIITYVFAGISPVPQVKVKSISAIANNKLKIVFTKGVDRYKAMNISNYYIYSDDTIIDILKTEYNSYDNAIIITTASGFMVHTIYKLDIKNICSEGNVTNYFVGTLNHPEVSIKTIKRISNTEFKIIFDGNVEKANVENLTNYHIHEEATCILSAIYNSEDNSVTLKINQNGLKPGNAYKLLISNICTNGTVDHIFVIKN